VVEEHKMDRCSYGEDGTCALHGVEVERRESMKVLTDSIPKILTWQNRIIGWSFLITAFVFGSYAYINIVKNDLTTQYTTGLGSAVAEIKIIGKQFEQLSNGQARADERHEAYLRSMAEMTSSIKTLTYMQFEDTGKKKKAN